MYGIETKKSTHASIVSAFFPRSDTKKMGTFFVDNSLRFVGSSPSKKMTRFLFVAGWVSSKRLAQKILFFVQDGSLRDFRSTSH